MACCGLGIYLAKLTDANGKQTYVPFDVRGNSHSPYVAVTPDTTYAAYNDWGGYSLYQAGSSIPLNDEGVHLPRAVKVSLAIHHYQSLQQQTLVPPTIIFSTSVGVAMLAVVERFSNKRRKRPRS